MPGAEVVPDEVVQRTKPGTLMLTPLGLALVMVETTDVIFAVDSIPAIFAITADPFLVFTSNVFAILGPAVALLRPGWHDEQVPLSQGVAGPRADSWSA